MAYRKQYLFVGGPFNGWWPYVEHQESPNIHWDTPPKTWQLDEPLGPAPGTPLQMPMLMRHTYRAMPWMVGSRGHCRWVYVADGLTDEAACDLLIDNYRPRGRT